MSRDDDEHRLPDDERPFDQQDSNPIDQQPDEAFEESAAELNTPSSEGVVTTTSGDESNISPLPPSSASADTPHATAPTPTVVPDSEPLESTEQTPQESVSTEPEPPVRSSGAKLDFGPRRLPPPSPFMQLVMGLSSGRESAPTEPEPWITPPPVEPAATARPPAPMHISALQSARAEISVNVQVSLTDDALRRIAAASARENAAVTQKQIEIVAKRLFDLDQEIFAREAHRRAIYRY